MIFWNENRLVFTTSALPRIKKWSNALFWCSESKYIQSHGNRAPLCTWENKCDLLWARVPSGLARALRCSASHGYAHVTAGTERPTRSARQTPAEPLADQRNATGRALPGIFDEIEASGTQQKGLIRIYEVVWDYQVHCCLITCFIWILHLCNANRIEVGSHTDTLYKKVHIVISLTTSLRSIDLNLSEMNSNVSLKEQLN